MASEPVSEPTTDVQEIAKACGKSVDALRDLGGFFSRFVEAPFEQGMGIVSDKLWYMRWERQVRYMGQVASKMQELGMSSPTRAVPMKIAIPIFQYASLEEQDELQDLWVKLLVNAADANSTVNVTHTHISILRDFGPMEAIILDKICSIGNVDPAHGVWTTDLPDVVHASKPDREIVSPRKDVQIVVQNLFRLGCLMSLMAFPDGESAYTCVCPTPLGYDLHKACTLPRARS